MIIKYHFKVLFFVLFLFLLKPENLHTQIYEGADAHAILKGSNLVKKNELTKQIQYVLFQEPIEIDHEKLTDYLLKIYQLNDKFKFVLIKHETDEIGFEHHRYQLTYNQIPILGSIIIVHLKDEKLHSLNGEVFNLLNINHVPVLNEKKALEFALDSIHAITYKWQLPEEEMMLKELKNDSNATWYPKAELMYVPKNIDFNTNLFYLSYHFKVYANEPLIAENIYIDASNGEIIARENLIHTTNVTGSANTFYSGTQTIKTDSTAPNSYRLRETTRGNGVYTLNLRKGTSYGAAVDFTDSNNVWNNYNVNKDEVATDCHWGAGKTYDYYKSKFNRNSYDNNNARINSYVHYSSNYDNAFWNGLYMTYGDGSSFKPLTSLDVCGHEITHAVTSNSANLIYSYESGALNESFSDIFGNAIERYGKPSNYSWMIGEEITYSGTGLRNMLNPKLKGHPRCYKSTNWYYGSGDNGGVHLNSGVQNWWFYLITEGGSGTNDAANSYKVDSLGIIKAEQIAYRNLTTYLTPSSQYSDARFYSIRAAVDLYGDCSKEVIAVTNAWYACNVGAKYDSASVKANFIADTIVCKSNKTVKFTNLSSNVSASKWYFGDGNSSTTFNPTHTYNSYGNFNIKLVVNSCFKNKKDSLTKTNYVKVDSTNDVCNSVFMPLSGNDSTSKCYSFVYDEGGLNNYKDKFVSNLRISLPGADSIRIKFHDFDYELNYDSLYIYRGKYPGGVKIAGFTGSSLPYSGNQVSFAGSEFTLRHVADPFVVGRGFKLYYSAVKKPIKITAFKDTTICKGNSTLLYAKGSGGYSKDYFYQWKGIALNDSITVTPDSTTKYFVSLKDVCTQSKDSANITVTVRKPLSIKSIKDTTICIGQSVNLITSVSGGLSSNYQYTWNNGLGNSSSHTVNPSTTTTYRVILSDGCTLKNDTAYTKITVRDPLNLSLNSVDTIICYNKISNINAVATGGNGNYTINWSNGLGIGSFKSITLMNSAWIKATLTDGCTVNSSTDSIYIKVLSPLKIELNNDSLICRGSFVDLITNSSGGKSLNYQYQWSNGLPNNPNQKVSPANLTKYYVTLIDNCSDPAKDSITIQLMDALKIKTIKDTTICQGNSVNITTQASGGKSSSYQYIWNQSLPSNSSNVVSPLITTSYKVTLKDGCTLFDDSATVKITVLNPLKLKLQSNDTIICYNKTSQIMANATGGNSNYTINWSNGLGVGLSKSLNLKNSTWIKATLTDACTVNSSSDSIFIKVHEPLIVELNSDTTICKGTDAYLMAKAKGGDNKNYTFNWNPSLTNNAFQTVNPNSNSTFIVELSDNCSDPIQDTINIEVLPAIQISGLYDTVICYGGLSVQKPKVSGGIPSQYKFIWSHGLDSSRTQTLNPKLTTNYLLTVTDNCTVINALDSVLITVEKPLEIVANWDKNEMCFGDSVKLNVVLNGGIASNYEWYINGVKNNQLVQYLKPSSSTNYVLELLDQCSLKDTTSQFITVNPLPIVNFQALDSALCEPSSFKMKNTSTGASSYLWTFEPNDTSHLKEPTINYSSPGFYDVILTALSDKQCESKLKKNNYLEVVKNPTTKFIMSSYRPNIDNPQVRFTNTSKDFIEFNWSFGDLTFDNVNNSPLHQYPEDTGCYNVVLETKNKLGCSDSLSVRVCVEDVFKLFIPTAISVNNDGKNETLLIKTRGVKSYDIKIFNSWGEMIYKGDDKSLPFDGYNSHNEPLMKGTYMIIIKLIDNEGRTRVFRQSLQLL